MVRGGGTVQSTVIGRAARCTAPPNAADASCHEYALRTVLLASMTTSPSGCATRNAAMSSCGMVLVFTFDFQRFSRISPLPMQDAKKNVFWLYAATESSVAIMANPCMRENERT